jgi:hypothetical protein
MKWVLAIVLLLVAAFLLWRLQYVDEYQLEIINGSQYPVDQVRLFGSAVVEQRLSTALAPGDSASILVQLHKTGAIRFEVSQQGNRIDTYIVQDVSTLEHHLQQLHVHPNNRFIISR